jgi:hypothetical protein
MITTSKTLRICAAVLSLGLLLVAGESASASTWERFHPRHDQVNDRLANQNFRIQRERGEGEINGFQAARLHREDQAVRREERLMAWQHRGHISRLEQRVLNQRENQISREIGR